MVVVTPDRFGCERRNPNESPPVVTVSTKCFVVVVVSLNNGVGRYSAVYVCFVSVRFGCDRRKSVVFPPVLLESK